MAITGQISFGTYDNMGAIVYDAKDAAYEIGEVYYGLDLIWKKDDSPVWKYHTLDGDASIPMAVKTLPVCRLMSFSFYTIENLPSSPYSLSARIVSYEGEPIGSTLHGAHMTTFASKSNMTAVCEPTTLKTEDGLSIYKVTYTANDTGGIIIPKQAAYVFCLDSRAGSSTVKSFVYNNLSTCPVYDYSYGNWLPDNVDNIGTKWDDRDFGSKTNYNTTIDIVTKPVFENDPVPDATVEVIWDYMNENIVISLINDGVDVSSYVDHYEYTFNGVDSTSENNTIPISGMDFTGTDKHYDVIAHAVSKEGNISATDTGTVRMPVNMNFSAYDTIANTLSWVPMYNDEDNYASRIARYVWICGSYSSANSPDSVIDCNTFTNGTYHAVVSAVTINGNRIKTSYSPEFVVDIDPHTWGYAMFDEQHIPAAKYVPATTENISGYTYYSLSNGSPQPESMGIVDIDNHTVVAKMKVSVITLTNKKTSDGKHNLYEYTLTTSDDVPVTLTAGRTYYLVLAQDVAWGRSADPACIWNEESELDAVLGNPYSLEWNWAATPYKAYVSLNYPTSTTSEETE